MNPTGDNAPPVVVLCGFMGTGKTAVGRALARRLGVDFIDTDAEIEAREGMSIASIFDDHGEEYFRALEAEVCRALAPAGGAVIATGGGMVMDPQNLRHLRALGTTVLLEATIDAIVARNAGGGRPLLAGADAGDIASLLASRTGAYEQCDLRLDTTRRTPDEAAHDLAEMLELRARGGRSLVPLRVDTRPIPGRAPRAGNTRLCRVVVGAGAASDIADWLQRLELHTAAAFVLAPAHLDAAVDRVTASLESSRIPVRVIPVDDGDEHKTLAQASRLIDALADAGAGRDGVVVAVGGGVTGDLAGFVASMYMRGVPFVQVPTSLLAQVDASIGGKVGVNHARAKNLLGSVYQPLLVLTDPELLSTLPEREMANGMAEVVKTAVIGSAGLFERLSREAAASGGRASAPFLADVVAGCARIKARVVELDPYERDLRRVLNLGHTLGHALESALEYRLAHGEAVGLGLLAAWRVAIARGAADRRWLDETRALLVKVGLPVEVPGVDERRVRDALGLDKKRLAGRMTFVLPRRPGRVDIVDDVTEDELISAMRD